MLVIVYENYFSTFDFSWSWLIYAFCIGNKKKKTAICLPDQIFHKLCGMGWTCSDAFKYIFRNVEN